jgi:ATP-dependent RNA helicase DHX37/DHR1
MIKKNLKFMTDGILLNELVSDALLRQYSVIVIDEAHERKVNTDILIAILARVVLARSKSSLPALRLVVMSATLRLEDFTNNSEVFPRGVNVIHVESRQFPVQNYFSKV